MSKRFAAAVPRLTMQPLPFRCGYASFMSRNVASGPESQPAVNASSLTLLSGPSGTSCASLTRMLSAPSCFTVSPTARARSSAFLTSHAMAIALPPRLPIAATVASSFDFVRAATATAAPSSASANAMPCPTPCPAPVTSATLPLSFIGCPSEEPRQEPRRALHVVGILGILRRADRFLQVRAALEQRHQQDAARRRPVEAAGRSDAEQEEHDPDRLLGEIVRMPGARPQAILDEAALVARIGIAGFLLRLEIPLLLIGHRLDHDEADVRRREDPIDHRERLAATQHDGNRDEQQQRVLVEADESEVEDLPHDRIVETRLLPHDR